MKYFFIQKENSDLRDLVQILIEKSSKLEEKMTGITTKGNNEQSAESPSTINDHRTLMPDVSKVIDNVYEFANQFFELLKIAGKTDNNIGTG